MKNFSVVLNEIVNGLSGVVYVIKVVKHVIQIKDKIGMFTFRQMFRN